MQPKSVSAKFGRVDALIHLVGGWTGGKTIAEVRCWRILSSCSTSTPGRPSTCCDAFSPKLAANGWGRVIAVTSPLATNPAAKMGAYAVGKAAQETLLMAFADEIIGTNITSNVIQVKAIDVKGSGKGTSPDEIVAAMLYLYSDEAGKLNGTRLPLY